MSEEQEQLFYEMKQYLVQHSQKWNTLCDIEQLIIDKDKEIERLNNIINELEKYYEEELKNLNYSEDKIYAQGIHDTIIDHKYKLQELKGDGINDNN